MITLQNTVDVNVPVERAFDFVVNLENVPKWQPAVIETKRLTEGPTRVGSQFREVAKMMGRKVETVCTITSLEPASRVAFKGDSTGPFSYTTNYVFEARASGTRIVIDGAFEFRGWWRLLEPLVRGELRKESAGELVAMKAAMERSG